MKLSVSRKAGAVTVCLVAGLASAGLIASSSRTAAAAPRALPAGPVYGVTIDDISNISQVVASDAALPEMPTTRVYLDRTEPAGYYSSALNSLHAHSYVMGEILDSSDMTGVTVSGEKSRVSSLISTLSPSVDLWEVGNEVNGNWTGPYSTGAQMVTNTFNQVKAVGGRTALTLYYNTGCGDGSSELDPITYSKDYLSSAVRSGLDYVLISYYQTECNNQVLSASTVTSYMQQLHAVFPNALLGFGEVGLPNPATSSTQSQAISIVNHYYSLPVNLPYYVGGYFYWYYDEDALPYAGNPVFGAVSNGMKAEASALPGSGSSTPTASSTTSTTASPTTTAPATSTTSTTAPPATSTTSTTAAPATSTTTSTAAPATSTTSTTAAPATSTTSTTAALVQTASSGSVISPSRFSSMSPSKWAQGSAHSGWVEQWNGYGSVGIVSDSTVGHDVLSLSPAISTVPAQTHSALVTSASTFASPTFTVAVRTVSQLRQGSAPNPWEVGWVLWDYTPDDSFYALVPKPNGWELDKEVKGNQYFIATGSSPAFSLGGWHNVTISQTGSTISVSVDGQHLTTVTDTSFSSGAIGLYCEDSSVHFGDVAIGS